MSKGKFQKLAVGMGLFTVGLIGLLVLLAGSGCASTPRQTIPLGKIRFCQTQSFPVSLDYGMPLDKAMLEAGYEKIRDYEVSPFISRTLSCTPGKSPALGRQEVSFRLIKVSVNSPISADEATVILEQHLDWGIPATLEELLAFSKQYPDTQKAYYIIAAGTSCYLGADDTYDIVPYIYRLRTSSFGQPERYLGITRSDAPMEGEEIRLLIRER